MSAYLLAVPSTEPPDTVMWPVLLLALVTICLSVLLHYFILWDMIGRLNRLTLPSLVAICGTVMGLIVAHLLEIGLFAVALFMLDANWGTEIGTLVGHDTTGVHDWYYYSAMVYTTVGFGDITPSGPLRIFAACEALTGLVLITWSASFTFLVMQVRWKKRMQALHESAP